MHREICVKQVSGTTAPTIFKFGTNIRYNQLHCERENQNPHAYHSFYLSIFLSLQKKLCSLDFSGTIRPRILKVSTIIGFYLYCTRENQHPHAYHFLYLSIFYLSHAYIRHMSYCFCKAVDQICVAISRAEGAQKPWSAIHLGDGNSKQKPTYLDLPVPAM